MFEVVGVWLLTQAWFNYPTDRVKIEPFSTYEDCMKAKQMSFASLKDCDGPYPATLKEKQ